MRVEPSHAFLARLFTDAHEPVFYPPKRVHHPTLPVEFPTNKTPKGTIRCRLPLMADALVHFDTDPNVVALAAYPLKAVVWIDTGRGAGKHVDHIADIAVKQRDGKVVFMDFEPLKIQKERGGRERKTLALKAYYREVFGCAYSLLDERSLYIEPFMSNIRWMWRHKENRTHADHNLLRDAKEVLRSTRLPATIGQIAEKAAFPGYGVIWEGDATPTPLPDPDRMFTAIMRLAMRGEVRLNLGQPLSMQSVVYKGEF
jgi:hypothetical protein